MLFHNITIHFLDFSYLLITLIALHKLGLSHQRVHDTSNYTSIVSQDVSNASPWAYIEPRKLLETPGAIYTKTLVGIVWKVLEMSRKVHTSLHYGGRYERSPRLSREF